MATTTMAPLSKNPTVLGHPPLAKSAKYAPDGTEVDRIRLPVRQPTMCTFGGPDLDVLYVTSATRFLEPGEAEQQPLAGALFAIHGTGATGLPEPFFKG